MAVSIRRFVLPATALAACVLVLPAAALANPGVSVVQNPNHVPNPDAVVIDFRTPDARLKNIEPAYPQRPSFSSLDDYASDEADPEIPTVDEPTRLPGGMAQIGTMVVPEPMLEGAEMVSDVERVLAAETGPVEGGGGAPDLNEICAFPDEVPPGIYDYDARPGGEVPRFGTVYLNYLGGVLSTNGENSAENYSGIARTGHMYPVYSGGEMRAIAAAQAVAADFEDLAVRIVYEERPPKVLPYTMVMMGGHYSDTTAGPSGGVAPLDCEDFGQRNVCYVFQNTSPAITQANIASQEIGHTLGLGHTNASDSVMAAGYAPTQGGDLGFNETCADIIGVQGQSAACTGVNRCHCGIGEAQHDANTLATTFAPAGVDMVDPTIAIISPEDGATFEVGEDVIIVVDPWDDVGGYGWKLTLQDENGEVLADKVDYDRALEFKLIGVPEGTYVATALVQDHADHTATETITFTVGAAAADDTGEDDNGSDDETDGAGTSSEGSDSDGGDDEGAADGDGSDGDDPDTDGDSGGAGADDLDEGCGCRSTPTAPSGLLAMVALLAIRRRRAV